MNTSAALLTPVSSHDRVHTLDVLRGFALFGILLVNILDYSPGVVSDIDRVLQMGIDVLADGTFYPLFSLLFGIGFAVFLGRAEHAGRNALPLYVRRVVGLFAFGVLQFVLLEERNILLRYAYLAIPLLLFWKATPHVCVIAAMIFLTLAAGRGAIHRGLLDWEMRDAGRARLLKDEQASAQAMQKQRQAAFREVAASRSYTKFVEFRVKWRLGNQLYFSGDLRRNQSLFVIMAMFVLGVALWRANLFTQSDRYRRFLWTVLVAGGPVGLVGNWYVTTGALGNTTGAVIAQPHTAAILYISNVLLMLAYGSGILLLCGRGSEVWRRRVAPLAMIGRMGLTNYLWQSVAMSILFLSYGAALEGQVPIWALPLIAVGIYLPCWPMSAWWLARFRFGPAEWVWRCITYARLQPLRISERR